MRHIIPISGKDSLTTAIIQRETAPDLPYEFIFNELGTELPETLEWLDKVERELNIKITRIGVDLIQVIQGTGFLPNHKQRYCTRLGKVEPMEAIFQEDEEAIIYFGLRADEPTRAGFKSKSEFIESRYPLREAGIGINGVYEILYNRGLMPPTFYWPALYDAVVSQMGAEWRSKLNQWQFDRLFAGRSRANCYFCYNQQRAEWVWLLMTHPDLFDTAERLELSTGAGDRRESDFYLIGQGFPLSKIRNNWQMYFRKRVNATVKVLAKLSQYGLFDDSEINLEIDGARSCGLFCGK